MRVGSNYKVYVGYFLWEYVHYRRLMATTGFDPRALNRLTKHGRFFDLIPALRQSVLVRPIRSQTGDMSALWWYRYLWKNIPFTRTLILPSSSGNCSPAPDLVFLRLMFPCVFLYRGTFFFTDTGVVGVSLDGVDDVYSVHMYTCAHVHMHTMLLCLLQSAIGRSIPHV